MLKFIKEHGNVKRDTEAASTERSGFVNVADELKKSKIFNFEWLSQVDARIRKAVSKDRAIEIYIAELLPENIPCNVIFDVDYYCAQAELKNVQINKSRAFEEYIANPATWHLSPHPLFDAQRYVDRHLGFNEKEQPHLNPLVHYLNYGASEFKNPSSLFRTEFYLSQVKGEKIPLTPLEHYLMVGYKKHYKVNAIFCDEYYRNTYNLHASEIPVIHYVTSGALQNYRPSILFNVDLYLRNVDGEISSPLEHYLDFENRLSVPKCCDLLDEDYYSEQYPGWQKYGLDILTHYLLIGWGEQKNPNPIFDVQYYMEQCDNRGEGIVEPLAHYLTKGYKEGYNPNLWFDTDFYVKLYPLADQKGYNPLSHYLQIARDWPLIPSEKFSPLFYISQHPSLKEMKCTALEHYIRWGRGSGLFALPLPAYRKSYLGLEELKERFNLLVTGFPTLTPPKVSVIIPVYNNFEYTLNCVVSMLEMPEDTVFEIVIIDDCSSDQTRDFFQKYPVIKYIRNEKNLGFLQSCNAAATKCKGEYLMFLNNDTVVKEYWLRSLVDTIEADSRVGLVGSKLVYPSGILQEAGGVIWSDGSAANYGRNDNSQLLSYNYKRDVDYISGASILLRKDLWQTLDGFDEIYTPAYCEDSDLAFKVRAEGYRVVYQPKSRIVHFEGISSGTDLSKGVKKYQVTNSQKLKEKWSNILQLHGKRGDYNSHIVNRLVKRKLLFIDAEIPCADKDAGSLTVVNFLKVFSKLGYDVHHIPVNQQRFDVKYHEQLSEIGVKLLLPPDISDIHEYLRENADQYAVVFLTRVNEGGRFYNVIRENAPDTRIVFNTVDIHYLRMQRQALIETDVEIQYRLIEDARHTKEQEMKLIRQCDATILLSHEERNILEQELSDIPSNIIPLVLETEEVKSSFEERAGIAFVGGYRHLPNVDAVKFFVNEIMPLLREKMQDDNFKFYIIGSSVPQELMELASDDVEVVGFVEDLGEYLHSVKLTVAPLRYGAGIKGKIGSSMSYGVPVVATQVASEGMGIVDGMHFLEANTPQDFANEIFKLYHASDLWHKLSSEGHKFVEKHYSLSACEMHIRRLFYMARVSPYYQSCSSCNETVLMNVVDYAGAHILECGNCGSNTASRGVAQLLDAYKVNHENVVYQDKKFGALVERSFQNISDNQDQFLVLSIHADQLDNLSKMINFKVLGKTKAVILAIASWSKIRDNQEAKRKLYSVFSKKFPRHYVHLDIGEETLFSDVSLLHFWS